jgi:6-phosphogluconolactonase
MQFKFPLDAATWLGVAWLSMCPTAMNAADALAFISSFKPGPEGAIEAFQLDLKAGRLSPVRRSASVENSYFLTLSPDHKFLYAIHAREFGSREPEEVAAFAIVGRTGQLRPLNRQSTHGSAACFLRPDATGKTLLVANYMNGTVVSLPVRKDGSLGEAVSVMQHSGPSAGAEPQEGPHAHCIVPTPDNRYACATDLGLDQVIIYQLDPAGAKLSPANSPPATAPRGAGPRHLVFHPNGRHLYVINELGGSISRFDYDPQTAALAQRQIISTLPEGFQGKNACADIKTTPNGRFLFGTNRGHDSIAVYAIGPDGTLALVEIVPSLGKEPQNLAITPRGDLLLCANLTGHNVAVFRINPETGHLTPIGQPTAVPSPACIRLLF